MSKDTTAITDKPTGEAGGGAPAPAPAAASSPPTTEPDPAGTIAGATTDAIGASSPDGALGAAELEALRARAARADEHRDLYLRTAADFENFKKRAARERQETARYATEALLGKLASVVDNFEIALASDGAASAAAEEPFRAGVALIHNQLRQVMNEAGLEEVDALGKPFDPNLHEAVAQQESADVPEGQVLRQIRKGYKYRDRLLRPASVVVAKPPQAPVAN